MQVKKIIAALLCCIIIATLAFAQKPIPGERMTAMQTASVVVRNLPPADTGYYPPKPRMRSLNPAKTEIARKTTTDEELRKPVFPVQTVTPARTMANSNSLLQRENIFEAPCITYAGLTQLNGSAGVIPPDVAGAVGFDHIFLTLNDRFRIQDKNGTVLLEQSQTDPNGFWSGVDVTNLFDPKIIYDPYRQRWTFVILTDGGSSGQAQNSAILIAVSQTSDPMGNWFQWRIDADAENDDWFDYPSVGFNKNWLVINGNMFNINSNVSNATRTFVFNINNLYAGGNVGYTTYTTTGYSTICPAMVYDPNMNDLWCATNDDTDDNDLRYFKVSGGPANPSFTEEGFVSIGSDWGRGGNDIGPQAGTTTRLNTNDHGVLSAVWRNNSLFTVQTIFLPDEQNPPDYCTIQFVIADPGSTTVHQATRFAANRNSMYAHPCLAVNSNGDVVISCTKLTNTTFASAAVLVRRGGTNFFTESVFKAGEDWYVNMDGQGRNRWGDYTTAMVDPSDDNSVWLASEYARPKDANNIGSWGTWWAKICSGVCIDTWTLSQPQQSGTMRKYEVSNVLYANNIISPGAYIKLDAGNRVVLQVGFKAQTGSRLKAFVEGCGGAQ